MTRVYESYHVCMSHVTCVWVMSHSNEKCYVCVSHVTYEWGMTHTNEKYHMWMRHFTLHHVCKASCHTHEWITSYTGWRRPTGCLKMQVIFHKRATNCMALSPKKPYKDKASYGSSPPCMQEARHICNVISDVTYEWARSQMNELCHIRMSHVSYEWVMSRMNDPHHIRMSHVTNEWVMSHTNESCHV